MSHSTYLRFSFSILTIIALACAAAPTFAQRGGHGGGFQGGGGFYGGEGFAAEGTPMHVRRWATALTEDRGNSPLPGSTRLDSPDRDFRLLLVDRASDSEVR